MNNSWEIKWSEDLISGNDELDKLHESLINAIAKYYDSFTNQEKKLINIIEFKDSLENDFLTHMDIEDKLLEELSIPNYEKHQQDHEKYRQKIILFNRYKFPSNLHTIMLCDMIVEYMNNHFLEFDIKEIPLISEKLKKL